jgi:hypothetical protein
MTQGFVFSSDGRSASVDRINGLGPDGKVVWTYLDLTFAPVSAYPSFPARVSWIGELEAIKLYCITSQAPL